MHIHKKILLFLLLVSAEYAHSQLEDVVPVEYRNWLVDHRHNTYGFFDSSNKANYKERIKLDSCYSFFAVLTIEGSQIKSDGIRLVEVPEHPAPDLLKKRAIEMIKWTDGKWAGPSKKVIFWFVYNRPNYTIDESIKNAFAASKYEWVPSKDPKYSEFYILTNNYLSIVNIW